VGEGQPWLRVGDALAAAPRGARVVVHPGTYPEPTLVIDRPLQLVGDGWPVLDGEGEREILRVTADSVTVRGLVLRNVGVSYVEDRAAVKVQEAGHCVLEGNRIENAFFGIYLARAHDCLVLENQVRGEGEREAASGNGIHLWYSRDVLVRGNRVSGHRDGIYFEFVQDARILENESRDNLRYGLHFMFSDGCLYQGNIFQRNNAGVAVMYTKRVSMLENRFLDNWGSAAYGLLLKDITDSEIRGNHFLRNTVGIYAEGTNRVEVEGNELRENGWAVRILANSQANRFRGNDFIGNTFDVATNSRRAYSTFEGNYWDRYRGYDLGRDGVGDVPFHPVRFFSLIVERYEPALILLRSSFVDLLDAAERVVPALTPEALADRAPLMAPAGVGRGGEETGAAGGARKPALVGQAAAFGPMARSAGAGAARSVREWSP
jgi:nitrous oxidase accessory protein